MAHCGCDPELEVLPYPLSFSLFFSLYVPPPCLQLDHLLSKASASGAALSGLSDGVDCSAAQTRPRSTHS